MNFITGLLISNLVVFSALAGYKERLQQLENSANFLSTQAVLERDAQGYNIIVSSFAKIEETGISDIFFKRELKIPVHVTLEIKNGFDYSYRKNLVGGNVQSTAFGGKFSIKKNQSIEDLFGTYNGKLRNLGMVAIGIHLSKAISQKGVRFTQTQLESVIPAPLTRLDINAGVSSYDYRLRIRPASLAVTKVLYAEESVCRATCSKKVNQTVESVSRTDAKLLPSGM